MSEVEMSCAVCDGHRRGATFTHAPHCVLVKLRDTEARLFVAERDLTALRAKIAAKAFDLLLMGVERQALRQAVDEFLKPTDAVPPHQWTPDETKNRCTICGDGPFGRHRFQSPASFKAKEKP